MQLELHTVIKEEGNDRVHYHYHIEEQSFIENVEPFLVIDISNQGKEGSIAFVNNGSRINEPDGMC